MHQKFDHSTTTGPFDVRSVPRSHRWDRLRVGVSIKGKPIPARSRVLLAGTIARAKRRHHCVSFSTAGGATGQNVVAGQVGTAMRPGPGIDDRMGSVDKFQVGVVDASSSIDSDLVVSGENATQASSGSWPESASVKRE